jgi:hypothetical protein
MKNGMMDPPLAVMDLLPESADLLTGIKTRCKKITDVQNGPPLSFNFNP